MLRTVLLIPILLVIAQAASPQSLFPDSDAVLSRCPTVARLAANGQLARLASPVFEKADSARDFARECEKVVRELDSVPFLPPDYAGLRREAALAAEFLTGDTYLLSTSNVKSVVKLREWVKIPPPPGLVFVKKYASVPSMPPEVADIFRSVATSEGGQVRGVTIKGRYIALLQTPYHDELVDNLAHEMVHAYITLAAQGELPRWFQEGAGVYFSTGKESRLYGRTGDPRMKQVTIPEDYKRKLFSFQYIEQKLGRKGLFEFVRRSVVTGRADPRAALGLGPARQSPKRALWPAAVVGAGIAIVLIVGWLISRRSETW